MQLSTNMFGLVGLEGNRPTSHGKSYKAHWCGIHDRVHLLMVALPIKSSPFVDRFNTADINKQARQSKMTLEKYWVHSNTDFCLIGTLFDISVADAWMNYSHNIMANHLHLPFSQSSMFEILENHVNIVSWCYFQT